jgi:hypothetical protein
VAEHGILFSAPMVRAILDGRKTQTRRVVRGAPDRHSVYQRPGENDHPCGYEWSWDHVQGGEMGFVARCPFGKAGDSLWVRETFYCDDYRYPSGPRHELLRLMEYRASHECIDWEAGCPCNDERGRSAWRPSIHMPRWASRITLLVTSVRVERLHAITEDDARAEGMVRTDAARVYHATAGGNDPRVPELELTYRGAFAIGWDSINAKRAPWATNPWVWVVSFEAVRAQECDAR